MKMIRPYILIFLIGLLTACSAPATNVDLSPPVPGRLALFTEVENDVSAKTNAEDEPAPAKIGQDLRPGGGAQSGEDSRARLDLVPDGTIIRLAPNSTFTLEALSDDTETPLTRLQLLGGQLWIILSGGELETDTPYGTASVRGSMMSVNFDPDDGLTVTCLEGHCTLANEAGAVELTEGFASVISAEGQPPSPPREISDEERSAWIEISPEAGAYLKGEPAPPPPEILSELIETIQPSSQTSHPQNSDSPHPSGGPLKYNLKNTCPDQVWHWEFEGPVSRSFSIPPGRRETGELPAGDYYATDWLEGGEIHGPYFTPGGGKLEVASCPG